MDITKYKNKIKHNYKKYVKAILDEKSGHIKLDWQKGLETLASIAEKADIEWWNTGNILLPLNGIDTDVTDLDFYFHKKDLEAVYDAFQDYIVEPIICGGNRADTFEYNGLAYINCTICMFSEPLDNLDIPEPVHFGKYAAANLEIITWKDYKIKVPPIELYIKTLEKWGKTGRVQFIRNSLMQII